jgi:hypothetical protein
MTPKPSRATSWSGSRQQANPSIRLFTETRRLIVDSSMTAPELCSALSTWTGLTKSKSISRMILNMLTMCRVKASLRSGEDVVTGDRWPIFLYADCKYDHEDPWNGLLRSNLVVNVCRLIPFWSPSDTLL